MYLSVKEGFSCDPTAGLKLPSATEQMKVDPEETVCGRHVPRYVLLVYIDGLTCRALAGKESLTPRLF